MIKNKGFTLIELLLSVAIIVIIGVGTILISLSSQSRNDVVVARDAWIQNLRRATNLAQSSDGDISWGAQLASGSITLFKGTSFGARDSNFDEVFTISPNLGFSGPTEIVFTKFTGIPTSTGSTTISSTVTNKSETITINSQGTIDY